MYDIIGDIHGYKKTLVALLEELGYTNYEGFYKHPERKAIFTGDFIDRGPDSRGVLKIVKAMIDNGTAMSVLGNHEFNALAYCTKDKNGNWLREHSKKNIRTGRHTRESFKNHFYEWKMYLEWFKTIPFFLEFENFRVIHACWDYKYVDLIEKISPDCIINNKILKQYADNESEIYFAIETLLKGKEIYLPEGVFFTDRDGNQRRMIRYKWWTEIKDVNFRDIAVNSRKMIPKLKVPPDSFNGHVPYKSDDKIVFTGHYWKTGKPHLESSNICCVDYSIAKKEKLVAYRYNNEKKLSDKNFVSVKFR